MTSVNIVQRQRITDRKFYVYYNEWTGEIVSTGRSLRDDVELPYLETNSKIAERILQGRVNHNDYTVAYDNNSKRMDLLKKDNVLRLRQQEDRLFSIPRSRPDAWDIRVRFYTVNNVMTVEINPDLVRRLANFNIKAELKVAESRNLNLYIVRRNQPDYLVEAVEIDPRELVKTDVLAIDVSSIVKHVSYEDLWLLTRRNFERYCFDVVHAKYVAKNNKRSLKQNSQIQVARDYEDSHFAFEQVEDRLLVSTSISNDQFAEFGFHQKTETFYLVGETPDQLVDRIEVDILRLRQGYIEHFELEDIKDIDDYNIIHSNSEIRVAKRKIL